MLKFLFSVVLVVSTCQTSLFAQLKKYTYQEMLNLAIENSKLIKQSQNSISESELAYLQSKMEFLPGVYAGINTDVSTGRQWSPENESMVDLEITEATAGVEVSVNLFDGFRRMNDLKRKKAHVLYSEHEFDRYTQDIIVQTLSLYIQVALDKELIRVADKNMSLQEEIYNTTKEFSISGVIAESDVLKQEVQVKNTYVELVRLQNKLEKDKHNLRRIVSLDPQEDFDILLPDISNYSFETAEYAIDTLFQQAILTRNDLLGGRDLIAMSEYDIKTSRSGYMPRLDVYYKYGSFFNSENRINTEKVSFTDQMFDNNIGSAVGFTFTIPIFNKYQVYTQVAIKKLMHENAVLQYQDAEIKAYNDIFRAVKNLEASKELYRAIVAKLQASDLSIKNQKLLYTSGKSTLTEFNIESQNYLQVNYELMEAKYNIIAHQVLLAYSAGLISDSIDPIKQNLLQ